MKEEQAVSSWEERFESPKIPVRIHMGDGAVREGERVYVRQLKFDAVEYDYEQHKNVSIGRALFLDGAVIYRYERGGYKNKSDQILKVERLDTGEDVWRFVRQSFGPGM